MDWYYVEAGNRVGPANDDQVAALVQAGRIRADTLVWHEGMDNWQAYGQLVPGGEGGQTAACSQCGRAFPVDGMISYQNAWVCAACKPAFFQRLQEGVVPAQVGRRYAGFWIRFVAKFIDGIVLWVVHTLIQLLFVAVTVGSRSSAATLGVAIFVGLLQWAVGIGYTTFFLGRFGATLGKMACGLRVIVSDGSKVSYLRALGRAFAEILSGLTLLIGYIIAAFDSEKRALHDHICDTRVIWK